MEEKREQQQKVKENFATKFVQNNEIPVYLGYQAVSKYRSIRRAIKRGKVDLYTGIVFPRRPFNNRKSSLGRAHNDLKKRIYEQYKERTIQ